MSNDSRHQSTSSSVPTSSLSEVLCHICGSNDIDSKGVCLSCKERTSSETTDGVAIERTIIDGGAIIGVIAMLVAVFWFWKGYEAGSIYFYPPVLFLVGVLATGKSIFGGKGTQAVTSSPSPASIADPKEPLTDFVSDEDLLNATDEQLDRISNGEPIHEVLKKAPLA